MHVRCNHARLSRPLCTVRQYILVPSLAAQQAIQWLTGCVHPGRLLLVNMRHFLEQVVCYSTVSNPILFNDYGHRKLIKSNFDIDEWLLAQLQ